MLDSEDLACVAYYPVFPHPDYFYHFMQMINFIYLIKWFQIAAYQSVWTEKSDP